MTAQRDQIKATPIPRSALFVRLLADDFALLPEPVRAIHQPESRSSWRGFASVQRGQGLWSRGLCWLFGFPPASPSVPVLVVKRTSAKGEVWQRSFGNRVFQSRLTETARGLTESLGPFRFLIGLRVEEGALHHPVRAGWLGPLPLPSWILPVSQTREYAEGGQYRFDVTIIAPLSGRLLVQYRGYLDRVED